MKTYNKEQFETYLKTKVAESTAKTYATDMLVCTKAFEDMKKYSGKELKVILEDFISNKKANKDYLKNEFLAALQAIGSNDSGLYDSLLSKAKHYLTMSQETTSESSAKSSSSQETVAIKFVIFENLDEGEDDFVVADDWIEYEVDSSIVDEYVEEGEPYYIDKLFPENKEQLILDYYGRVKNAAYTCVRIQVVKYRDIEVDLEDEAEDCWYDSISSYEWLQTEFSK